MICTNCSETDKDWYMIVGDTAICNDCNEGSTEDVHSSTPNIFLRWKCLTHACGSYNFNNLNRHEMHDCKVIREETVGIVKPKTYGGHNGDVSRKWYKTEHDVFVILMRNWRDKIVNMKRHYNVPARRKRNDFKKRSRR